MAGENFKSMDRGAKYNIRRYSNPKYETFLQNKEFAEYLAKNFDNSMENIVEAISQFKVEMPNVQLPELDLSTMEDGLEAINHNIIIMIEEQKATNDYIMELITVMQHVAGIKKVKK